ncbi:hypothetical protein RRG08_008079 [Elysia crispata]|uniref:Uncharacterized protein n=1 Tax=Elysia crispata TaxID=231223 RepID=A0AAE0Y100_9GAST|nr:hypothetical protein RRG08_008079 [Elysia crispata]
MESGGNAALYSFHGRHKEYRVQQYGHHGRISCDTKRAVSRISWQNIMWYYTTCDRISCGTIRPVGRISCGTIRPVTEYRVVQYDQLAEYRVVLYEQLAEYRVVLYDQLAEYRVVLYDQLVEYRVVL